MSKYFKNPDHFHMQERLDNAIYLPLMIGEQDVLMIVLLFYVASRTDVICNQSPKQEISEKVGYLGLVSKYILFILLFS